MTRPLPTQMRPPNCRDDHEEIWKLAKQTYLEGGSQPAKWLVQYCAEIGLSISEHDAQLEIDTAEEDFYSSLDEEPEADDKPRQRMGRRLVLTAEEWEKYEVPPESNYIVGSPDNPIVRPETKNLILAPEKSFKTTFGLRLAASIASGQTLFSKLPVPAAKPRKVLYLHGELSFNEMKERIAAAVVGITTCGRLLQGRDLRSHLIEAGGQAVIEEIVKEHKPEVLFIDPWQSFITGKDENGIVDVGVATDFFNKMIERYRFTLFMQQHTGKDVSKGGRGHSSIAGWRDSQFKLARNGSRLRVEVDPRWASAPEPFNVQFEANTVREAGAAWFGNNLEIRNFIGQSSEKLASREDIINHLCRDGKRDRNAARAAVSYAQRQNAIETRGEDSFGVPGQYGPTVVDLTKFAK